ncbi:MAG: ABC transporter permease [Eubacteriaceae bacterium]|nr:ABC transporter permease [Eubacteriaceae bacterium]
MSLSIFLAIALASAFAPIFATHDPNKNELASSLAMPSALHWLGCDQNGRDIYSRLLYGGRTALLGAIGVVGISIALGIPLGLLCGFYGGLLDRIAMSVCDIILAFPTLLLALIFVAAFGRGLNISIIALGIVYVPMLARLSRSLAIVEKNKPYVQACIALGYSPARIIFKHILMNCISTISVQLSMDIGYAILDLSALSFLGLGVLDPTADWGAMLSQGRLYIMQNPMLSLAPGAAIVLITVSINIFSDCLRQYLDSSQAKLPSFEKFDRQERHKHG